MNRFGKWKIFSFSPSLFQPSPFSLSFSLSAAQKTPRQPVPRRPVSPLPARSGPAPPPPPCLAAKGVPPVGIVFLSGPSRTPARNRPRSPRARRRVPLGPARQGPCSAPIKGTLDPWKPQNRSRSRRLRKNLARAAAIVEASRSFAAPPFRFVFSTTSLLRSPAVVRGTSPTFYLPPSRSVSAAVARRRFRSAMRRR